MTYFQFIALIVTGSLFAISLLRLVLGKQPRRVMLAATTVWFLSFLFILSPNLTMQIANLLGIGRGADLVLYVFAILFIVTFFYFYARFRTLESQLTKIVRHIALSSSEH
jgi:hypothetical protein